MKHIEHFIVYSILLIASFIGCIYLFPAGNDVQEQFSTILEHLHDNHNHNKPEPTHAFEKRRLVEESNSNERSFLRRPGKMEKFKKLLSLIETSSFISPSINTRIPLTLLNGSRPINPHKHAIITCALSTTFTARDASNFVGTARRSNILSDIVVVVLPNSDEKFIGRLLKYNTSIFVADLTCTNDRHSPMCSFPRSVRLPHNDRASALPVTLARFYLYQHVTSLYSPNSFVMISDFRDVYFQSNPFTSRYVINSVKMPYDIMMFQEAHPNKVINRCAQNIGYLVRCYSEEILRYIGFNDVSSSGVVIGARSAILAYSYLITTQIDPTNRNIFNTSSPTPQDNDRCLYFGADQGFHNVLLYSHVFGKFFDIKLFPQGEGPVNIVGGFFGDKKLLRAHLSEWKLMRGEAPFKYVYNWNGEISPVIHQLDRFLGTELEGGYAQHMSVFQNLYANR
mmetsp:Transcript_30122/g.32830  ORF Transcript_30122/g.32830 Transcript_30122/m.32830 type:complete len:453 (-) Transcript_30122:515-1873(-)|eukprot:CAMPEP_0173157240 /NCGR_PEP_ID=MMETSP1105-20130129/15453_1 /TAXON_ID=2985 /ORGANISM="Ochromonas sp., Strain BG-1" /LENGTH=452 /DNA_ID=CAMNT_0014074559 /DNA_START=56 /DNA_END=1414 /DNA_ORIENTATION=-